MQQRSPTCRSPHSSRTSRNMKNCPPFNRHRKRMSPTPPPNCSARARAPAQWDCTGRQSRQPCRRCHRCPSPTKFSRSKRCHRCSVRYACNKCMSQMISQKQHSAHKFGTQCAAFYLLYTCGSVQSIWIVAPYFQSDRSVCALLFTLSLV